MNQGGNPSKSCKTLKYLTKFNIFYYMISIFQFHIKNIKDANKNYFCQQFAAEYRLDKYEVLVIDDISYIPYEKEESDLLFVLLAERYEQRSLVITSNLVFSKWNQIFQDEMTTTAAIDRLVHHATILELNTESYRMNAAKLAKSHPNKIQKTRAKNMGKSDVK